MNNLNLQSKNEEENRKMIILRMIEDIMQKIYNSGLFKNNGQLLIIKRCDWKNVHYSVDNGISLKANEVIKYTVANVKKKAQLLLMLCKIYQLIVKNENKTKRSLYYEENYSFKNQSICDNIIDDICSFVGFSRNELHIYPTSKGLVAGNLIIELHKEPINCVNHKHGFLIPNDLNKNVKVKSDAKFIIVIEKDAIFQQFIQDINVLIDNRIIALTGKGFPDTSTRMLAKILSEKLKIPLFGFFDADPFGIEIMCCFKYGSLALAYANEVYATPKMNWKGLYPSEIKTDNVFSFQNISQQDWKKIQCLLKRPYVVSDNKLKDELNIINIKGVKAGIQSLKTYGDSNLNVVQDYILKKIQQV